MKEWHKPIVSRRALKRVSGEGVLYSVFKTFRITFIRE